MNVPAKRGLLRLPNEILTWIARMVQKRQDLNRLTQTCKHLNRVSAPVLYEDVGLLLSQNHAYFSQLGILLNCRQFLYTRKFSIYNYWRESETRAAAHIGDIPGGFEHMTTPKLYYPDGRAVGNGGRHTILSIGLQTLILSILQKIPKNQLTSFCWFHRFPVSQEISQLVFDNHSQSLRIFHVAQPSSLSDGWTFSKSPNTQNLESIELRNLVSHNSISIIHALVNANSDTLASLTLGKEKHKFLNFADDDVDYLSGLDWNGEDLQLRCLGATSITLRSLMNDSFDPYVKFRMLRRLSLESCPRSQEFMLKMSEFAIDSTRGTPLPRLQEFVFRYEKPSEGLIQALESFLFTLPGLTLLSVLLEKAFRLPDITCILNHHAASLKILVWEGRTGPRLRSCEDTSFSVGTFGESNSKLSKICQSCKGLIELGIAFDWKDADMGTVDPGFLELPNLKTLHIRNAPVKEVEIGSGCDQNLSRGLAAHFLQSHFGFDSDENPWTESNLKTLIIGPLEFGYRWDLEHDASKAPSTAERGYPVWNRPRIFSIERATSQLGKPRVLVDQREFTSLEDLRQDVNDTRVLDSLWVTPLNKLNGGN